MRVRLRQTLGLLLEFSAYLVVCASSRARRMKKYTSEKSNLGVFFSQTQDIFRAGVIDDKQIRDSISRQQF